MQKIKLERVLCCSAHGQLLSKYVLQPFPLIGGKEKAVVRAALTQLLLRAVTK